MTRDSDEQMKAAIQAAGKRAADKQPDEIRLAAAPGHAWANATAIDTHAKSLQALGFADAGTYTVNVLPVALRFALDQPRRMYATIYEHPKAGVWMNFVVLYQDGASITFTTTPDRGLEQRPGHPIVHRPGASAAELHTVAMRQLAGDRPRKALSAASIVAEFERAWAEGVRWRKQRGFATAEIASVLLSRDGLPMRALRAQRIEFLGEQDGPPERTLKAALAAAFAAQQTVEKAYLARVRYDESTEPAVALCLASATPNDTALLEAIRQAFAAVFRAGTHLDILFVAPSDVPRLEGACAPFWFRAQRSLH
jgi:hypothetical protein